MERTVHCLEKREDFYQFNLLDIIINGLGQIQIPFQQMNPAAGCLTQVTG